MAIKGYFPPLSPSGDMRLVGKPPWHFSGNFTVIDFTADPDAAAAALPPGFEPSENPGACTLFFAEYQSCSDDMSEMMDPVRSQYSEGGIIVQGTLDGKPWNYTPYIWTSTDFSLARGYIQGHHKRIGQVAMTRVYNAGKVTPKLEEGGHFAATLSSAGRLVAEGHLTLKQPATSRSNMQGRPMATLRLFPKLDETSEDVFELVRVKNENVEVVDMWEGDATMSISPDAEQDVLNLAPISVGKGYRWSMGWSITGGSVIKRVNFER